MSDRTRPPEDELKHDMRLAGYIRVSTTDQALDGYGLAAQEAAIRSACETRGWALAGLFSDEGKSGKTLEREALSRALSTISSGDAHGLVVAKLDRLSRSVADVARLLEWFAAADAALIAIDVGVDTSTPGGRLIAGIFATIAEWERHTIGDRTKAGLAAARAAGHPISRSAVTDNSKLHRRIQRMRSRGMTLQAIADRLNAENVPTLRGGATWRPSAIQRAVGYQRRPPVRRSVDLPVLARRSAAHT